MQGLTKKRHTKELVSLTFRVRPENVDRIKRYVESVEPGTEEGSITVAEFFERNFPGESRGSVALKGIRYRENLTQKQLAEATGIPQRHISEMEAGKRPIGKETARKLAAVLNCDYRGLL